MSGYVEAGYAVVLATLAAYSASVLAREKSARRRLGGRERDGGEQRAAKR